MCALFSIERDRERLQLLLRVATLYWIEGESQADIAVELGYSRPQISRLLAEARRRGVVSVNVHHPLERALELEKLRSRAFEKMIQIAEQEEGISILKKGGARQ